MTITAKMKTFTLEQANRTLPLVSRIVQDIVTLYPRWMECMSELDLLNARARADDHDPRRDEIERQAQSLARDIDACIHELRALGMEYKMPLDAGLVDFPGELQGRPIYLCWRLGERAVTHWHELDAGFAGRRPIASLALT